MQTFSMPEGAVKVIDTLRSRGFEAYIVGGCVRDTLLGLVPHDWDICTSARPEELESAFAGGRVIETGIKHGTLRVLMPDGQYEVTSYRLDGEYSDNRHPDSVTFTRELRQDLSRRDFTINAMAASPEGELVDLFGGREDLRFGLLRCVGDPVRRFNEDGLRILRALRFASTYSLSIEPETAAAVRSERRLLNNISAERVRDELVKLLMGDGAERILTEYRDVIAAVIPELEPCFDLDQHNPHHVYDVYTHIVKSVAASRRDPAVRLTMLFHDIGKPACLTVGDDGICHFRGHAEKSAELADDIMTRLRFDNDTRNAVTRLVRLHDVFLQGASVKRVLSRIGPDALSLLFDAAEADTLAHAPGELGRLGKITEMRREAVRIVTEKQPFSMRDLAVNGDDLINAGIAPGPELGRILEGLLAAVLDDPSLNERETLIKMAVSDEIH